ncbi:MAG: hypothetical protein ACREL5_03280 [Gemmatimonadales bacterium]
MFVRSMGCRRSVAVLLGAWFLVQTSGCTSWKPVTAPAPTEGQNPSNGLYRITTKEQRVVELRDMRYRNDSIVGLSPDDSKPIGVAVADVATVDRQAADAGKTAALGGLLLGGVLIVAAAGGGAGTGGGGGSMSFGNGGSISCPLIYSWNGHDWHLDSGTFGGAITPALARTDLDNLIFAHAESGLLKFRMTDEADETEHVDAFTVVAVDHPAGTDVAPDARANGTFHVVDRLRPPLAARDLAGRDVLPLVDAPDAHSWESAVESRDPQNPAQLRDGIEATFARPEHSEQLQLVVDAQNTEWAATMMGEMVSAFGRLTAQWYAPATSATASAPMARAQHEDGFLAVSVWDGRTWRPGGEIWEAGPEVAKRQVLPIDVAGIPGDSIRIRLESAPSFWRIDYLGLGPVIDAPIVARDLPTISATSLRTPDALERLQRMDGRYLDMERGDTVAIAVRDTAAAPSPGVTRSYLARTSGWYRVHGRDDAAPDIAALTALGQGPHAPARLAVIRMNEALVAARAEGSHASPR